MSELSKKIKSVLGEKLLDGLILVLITEKNILWVADWIIDLVEDSAEKRGLTSILKAMKKIRNTFNIPDNDS